MDRDSNPNSTTADFNPVFIPNVPAELFPEGSVRWPVYLSAYTNTGATNAESNLRGIPHLSAAMLRPELFRAFLHMSIADPDTNTDSSHDSLSVTILPAELFPEG